MGLDIRVVKKIVSVEGSDIKIKLEPFTGWEHFRTSMSAAFYKHVSFDIMNVMNGSGIYGEEVVLYRPTDFVQAMKFIQNYEEFMLDVKGAFLAVLSYMRHNEDHYFIFD